MGSGAEWSFGRANQTLQSAEALRRQNRDWPNVYYLSGLAVEHILWAIRMQRASLTSPDYHAVTPNHDISRLAVHCGLKNDLEKAVKGDKAFHSNWRTVCDWDSNSRFEAVSEADAKDIFLAVSNPTAGVMLWLRNIYQAI